MAIRRGTKGRIAIVTPDIVGPVKNGGIGTACFHYARTLVNADYEVDILFSAELDLESRTHWVAWYRDIGINFFTLDNTPPLESSVYGLQWHTSRAYRIMTFLRPRFYNYVIFQDWHANGFWTVRSRQMGAGFATTAIGVIAHSPNEWQKVGMQTFGAAPVEDAALEWAERQVIAGADVLISPSRYMIEWLKGSGFGLPNRIAVCPCTFEDSTQPGDPETVDRDHLIFFGRLETRKGLHLLGDALRNQSRMGHRLPRRLSCLGKFAEVQGTPAGEYLRDLQNDLHSVEFFSNSDFDYRQAVHYIRDSNGVVVIPSLLDNHPLTVIESISNGFGFIASNVGGIPEMIDPAVCFPATVEGLQRKLEELPKIEFGRTVHPYDHEPARTTWLTHVDETVGKRRPTSSVRVLREAIRPVSVCVPFFRHDEYIGRMISSFLGMDLPQLQLVIVDDGTPAHERLHFDALRRDLEPLGHIFHTQLSAGPGTARNQAASLAAHDLILFFDADNVAHPDLIVRLCAAMTDSGADSISVPFIGVPPMHRRPTPEDGISMYISPGGPPVLAVMDNVLGDACAIIRRTVFEILGGFAVDRDCWEDWEFFLRLVGAGYRHYVYPDPLFFYTVDPQGRYLQSNQYVNRKSLLRCVNALPPELVSDIVSVFVTNHLTARSR